MNRDIDRVIAKLKTTYPMMTVEQLCVAHPGADDDGLWFFRHPDSPIEVQLESSTGAAPFLVESDDGARLVVGSVDEAVEIVGLRLGLRERTAYPANAADKRGLRVAPPAPVLLRAVAARILWHAYLAERAA